MAIPSYAQPFGLRDVRLTPLGADGSTPGTAIDLPASRVFKFAEVEKFEDFRGDDALITQHGSGPHVEWSLESGGLSVDAYAIIAGGTVTTSGVTPNVKKTYSKTTLQSRPFFKAEGQAISDNGGDVHGLVYKCKATDKLEGSFEDEKFYATNVGGNGFGSTEASLLNKLYDFIHNETAAVIP